MNKEMLIIAVIAILALLLIVSLIRKAIKLVFLIIIIIVGVSLVDIFAYGVSPIEEFNAYKTNIKYTEDVASLTSKVSESASNIKDVIENKKINQESLQTLKKENSNLHNYQKQFENLKHTKRLNGFHSSYDGYLSTLITVSDSTIKIVNSGSKTITNSEELLNKIEQSADKLSDLKP